MADASILAEPGAGTLHAGIGVGAVGSLAVLPRWLQKPSSISKELPSERLQTIAASHWVYGSSVIL
jgi:hypothetical protein